MDNEKLITRAREIIMEAYQYPKKDVQYTSLLDDMFATNNLSYKCWRFDTFLGGQDKLALQRVLAMFYDLIKHNVNPTYTPTDENIQSWFNQELTPHQLTFLGTTLRLLHKAKDEDYARYIKRISTNSNATIIKLADLIRRMNGPWAEDLIDECQLEFMYLAGEYWLEPVVK